MLYLKLYVNIIQHVNRLSEHSNELIKHICIFLIRKKFKYARIFVKFIKFDC